jgi:uncharacterized protein YeeX (DUF496 family)
MCVDIFSLLLLDLLNEINLLQLSKLSSYEGLTFTIIFKKDNIQNRRYSDTEERAKGRKRFVLFFVNLIKFLKTQSVQLLFFML